MIYLVFGMIYLVFEMMYLVLLIAFPEYNWPPVRSFVIVNLGVELQEPKVSRQSGAGFADDQKPASRSITLKIHLVSSSISSIVTSIYSVIDP